MNKELSDEAPVKFEAFLDSQDFYELMQAYRLAPIDAAKEFEAVRFALRAAIALPTKAIAQIEAALAARPTDDQWYAPSAVDIANYGLDHQFVCTLWKNGKRSIICRIANTVSGRPLDAEDHANAQYIAACNPTAMREVIDHIAAQDAEIARLREVVERLNQSLDQIGDLAKASEKIDAKAHWINDEQAIVDYTEMMELRAALKGVCAAIAQPTPAEYAQGYAEGFNDACKPAQPVQPADSTTLLKVGDSSFEEWYQAYSRQGISKQVARDAYSAGMGDPLVTIAQPVQPAVLTCKKCVGAMEPGQAIAQTFGGTNDFIGDKTVCTISPCGPGKLVSCMKCIDCGWSTS